MWHYCGLQGDSHKHRIQNKAQEDRAIATVVFILEDRNKASWYPKCSADSFLFIWTVVMATDSDWYCEELNSQLHSINLYSLYHIYSTCKVLLVWLFVILNLPYHLWITSLDVAMSKLSKYQVCLRLKLRFNNSVSKTHFKSHSFLGPFL